MTLTFTHIINVTYVHSHTKFGAHTQNTSHAMNLLLVIIAKITDRQKATLNSQLCICIGGLENTSNVKY